MTRKEEIQKEEKIFHASSDDYTVYKKGFKVGAEWADDTMIEKACKWLEENANKYINQYSQDDYSFDMQKFVSNFKKAMKE